MRRRALLQSVSGFGLAGLAGCVGRENDTGGTETATPDTDDAGGGKTKEPETDELSGPVETLKHYLQTALA